MKCSLILLETYLNMSKKLLTILMLIPFLGMAQQTYVPDDDFEQLSFELIDILGRVHIKGEVFTNI
jgi:hypothetical protein